MNKWTKSMTNVLITLAAKTILPWLDQVHAHNKLAVNEIQRLEDEGGNQPPGDEKDVASTA
jgi:hypothetical protein